MTRSIMPVTVVVASILVLWYIFAVFLNTPWARDQAQRADRVLSFPELISETLSQDKPRLPAPHQVAEDIWETTAEKKISSKRSASG